MRIVTVVALVVAFAGSAAAQPSESRTSITVVAGTGRTFDDEGSLGRGWLAGGSIDRVLFGSTRGEVSIELLTHSRDAGYFASDGRTVTGAASLVQRFGRAAAQPYLFAGLTVGHHSGTNRFMEVTRVRSSTDLGLRFGTGVSVRVGRRFEISPELRMNGFFINDGADPTILPSFGIRLGVRL